MANSYPETIADRVTIIPIPREKRDRTAARDVESGERGGFKGGFKRIFRRSFREGFRRSISGGFRGSLRGGFRVGLGEGFRVSVSAIESCIFSVKKRQIFDSFDLYKIQFLGAEGHKKTGSWKRKIQKANFSKKLISSKSGFFEKLDFWIFRF